MKQHTILVWTSVLASLLLVSAGVGVYYDRLAHPPPDPPDLDPIRQALQAKRDAFHKVVQDASDAITAAEQQARESVDHWEQKRQEITAKSQEVTQRAEQTVREMEALAAPHAELRPLAQELIQVVRKEEKQLEQWAQMVNDQLGEGSQRPVPATSPTNKRIP